MLVSYPCACKCTTYVSGADGEKLSDPLNWCHRSLWTNICVLGKTQVLCESTECSKPLSHFSTPIRNCNCFKMSRDASTALQAHSSNWKINKQKDYWTCLVHIISLNLHIKNDTFLIPHSLGVVYWSIPWVIPFNPVLHKIIKNCFLTIKNDMLRISEILR